MARFEQENQRHVTNNDMDLTVLNHPTCGSLNEKINEDGDEVLDLVEDKTFERPDSNILTEEVLKGELDKTLSILSDREKRIVDMYFGIDGGSLTLEQIGDEFGLTKERIRQIKEKALRKLKNNCDNLFEFVQK